MLWLQPLQRSEDGGWSFDFADPLKPDAFLSEQEGEREREASDWSWGEGEIHTSDSDSCRKEQKRIMIINLLLHQKKILSSALGWMLKPRTQRHWRHGDGENQRCIRR